MVARAAAHGVTTLALTDHDTFAGLGEARAATAAHGMRLVVGVEITTRAVSGSAHLIGLFASDPPTVVAERLVELRAGREQRARRMLERLAELGAPLDIEDVAARAGGPIGRPHVADALVSAGHASDRADAFARLIGHDAPAFVPHQGITTADAVRLVAGAGGAPVLAHPATLRLGSRHLDSTVAGLASAGLVGIEVHRPEHTPDQRAHYAALARTHGLIEGGGSDFHLPGAGVEPGSTGDPGLPDGTADRLLTAAAQRSGRLR